MFTAAGFERTWEYIDLFKEGLICTVSLSLLTVIFGFVLALLLAIMRLSNVRPFRFLGLTKDGHLREQGVLMVLSRFNPLSFIATVYVEVFRATPMLVQLFMIYYVVFGDIDLPSFKIFGTIRFERFLPGVIALSLNSGAYLSEIIRSGIQSIDGGQTEAARSLGLSQVQNMRFVILPQAIKNILPAIANEFVTIIKETSILGMVGIVELMFRAQSIAKQTYIFLEPYVIAAIMYFIIVFPLSKIIAAVERRMSKSVTR